MRALLELAKVKQASLDNLVLIGIDCLGTCTAADYKEYRKNADSGQFWKADSQANVSLRQACQVCEFPAAVNADLNIGLVGMDLGSGLLIESSRLDLEPVLKTTGMKECPESALKARETALSELKARRIEARNNSSNSFRTRWWAWTICFPPCPPASTAITAG
jgi:formate dehydrogenase subunit beta